MLSALSLLAQGNLTLQIGSSAAPPAPLVNHGDTWRYHLGTSAPAVGWETNDDSTLDGTWLAGAGGFGYSTDNSSETNLCKTIVTSMLNGPTTLYIRRTFTITDAPDPGQHLRLTVDWDDGFVAYLDGVEVQRQLAPGTVGVEIPNTAIATGSHESSNGNANNSPQPAVAYDLGPVGGRLAPGKHVLALVGLNRAANSTDLILVADLALTGGSGGVSGGRFFSLLTTNVANLFGSNTLANSTRVVVNGVEATFDQAAGTWSKSQTLVPGMNRVFIAALDSFGNILASTNRDIIYEVSSTSVGGTLAGNTSWSSSMGVIRVTSDVIVPAGVALSAGDGLVVLLGAGVSIRATAGGSIDIAGSEDRPNFLLPADGTSNWGAINATGSGASVTARHIETAAGAITFNTQANGLIEDSYLHDRVSILTANGAGLITSRRIHVRNYEETIYNSGTRVLAEDSLYEGLNAGSADCLEIQGGPPGSIVRRCTFRHSTGPNSDAVDFNGTSGATIESCLIHDISDKGISMGASGAGGSPDFGILISNCLVYRVDTGIAVKDNGTASVFDTTISASPFGIRSYQKFTTPIGGGHVTNGFNNLIWGNGVSIDLADGGTFLTDYSDIEGTNWPGIGNISADPFFADTSADDYRLTPGSPATGTGLNGSDMGVRFPVGGLPGAPLNLAAYGPPVVPGDPDASGFTQIWWQDDADNEAGFEVQRSTDGVAWQTLSTVLSPNITAYTDSATLEDQLYFYRVRATNSSGASPYSNIASAVRKTPTILAGGTLTENTSWSGTVLVRSSVIVPSGISLTIVAGADVKLTNGVSITAQAGGSIHVIGTEDRPAVLERWNGTNNWSELRADGAGASLVIQHADISGGQTTVYNGASGLFEDSFFHDFLQQGATTTFNQPIILTHFAAPCTARRILVRNYYETLWRHGLNLIEDSVFEDVVGDALDMDAALPGSTVRNCTFRHGDRGNVDAVDIGNDGGSTSSGVLVTGCMMYDFPFDKGVSIGEGATNTVVTNCFIHHCNWGIGVKDSCTAGLFNNTISACDAGFRLYNKIAGQGSGLVTNSFSNILWGNTNGNIVVLDGGAITATYSDVQGGWPGVENFDVDPLFVNVAADDYRVAPNSPTHGRGYNGEDMGAHFPVGSVMVPSHPSISSIILSNGIPVLRFWADSEHTYRIERSDAASGGTWTTIRNVGLANRPRIVTITYPESNTGFYRLVRE